MDNRKFDFNDIVIIPPRFTNINSRKEVTPFFNTTLPLIVSPMDTVVDGNNFRLFLDEKLRVCMPRGINPRSHLVFHSVSLEEFEEYIANGFQDRLRRYTKILVDIANGHMMRLISAVKRYKAGIDILQELMIGNIANPSTYDLFAQLGVDFVRCGIGGGSACTTSANTGVHYPMASLISECYQIKKENDYETKIVADGGFRNYDDIIKALALGADFVMLGSILNKCLESCSPTYLYGFKVDWCRELLWECGNRNLYKSYRGMSTKDVQKTWGREKLKTAEGISKTQKVEYTLSQWVENFEAYLRSAMSYTNSRTLEEFKESEYVFITEQAFRRFHK